VFEVRERDGLGRIGRLETPHGRVTTPALLPVVNPNRPIIPPAELATAFGAEILITNAYILGKGPSRDWSFWTSYNSEEAKTLLEANASQKDKDYIAAVNRKAAREARNRRAPCGSRSRR